MSADAATADRNGLVDRWRHQPEAVAAITRQLRDGGRTTVLAACGTGKSTIAARAALELVPDGLVLILVPRLELAAQMLDTFHRIGGAGRLVAVCSDKEMLRASELGLNGVVSTDPGHVAVAAAPPGRVTAVCTYASQQVASQAHLNHGLRPSGLIIADEAHRTAGRAGQAWGLLHDDVLMPAERRLYMTATARIFTGDTASTTAASSETSAPPSVSMDDPKVFGPVCFELKTGEGIRRGLLADWRLLVPVCDPDLLRSADPLQIGRVAVTPSVLAQQTAVLRAAAQHDIRALLTYHSRVADARSWAMTVPQTWELMPDDLRPSRVRARYVHGTQSLHARQTILRQLAEAGDRSGDGGLQLVANARVLTEGVDIPAVDGVALIDPRSSIIDIIQIIGRALRIGDRPDKIATIIVPVLLSPGESPETALSGSPFKPLWRVLLALRAHDDRLQRSLDTARMRLAANTGHHADSDSDPDALPDWLSLTGDRVPDGFAQAVWLRAVRMASPAWMEFYGAARAWRDAHGHLNVPYEHRTQTGLWLGRWLSRQFGRDWPHLTAHHRTLLTQIGPWESELDRKWRAGMAAARAWVTDHPEGLHAIPRGWTHDGVPLWDWVARRRLDRRAGKLSAARDTELCTLDPTWYLTRTGVMVRAARAFYRQHGHVLPAPDYRTPTGYDLHAWLENLRNKATVGQVNPKTRHALNRLGMIWSRREAQLARGVLAARAHAAAHGSLAIPATHHCRPDTCGGIDYPTGDFLRQQKQSAREGSLRPWVRTALTGIDPGWYRSRAERRAHKLALAAAYVKAHGHLPRAKGHGLASPRPDGEDFRPWLAEMRVKARKGTLPADLAAELDALDPNWCPPRITGQTPST
ncbi:Helicase associated domain protein [Actinomadura bangladeshensis]|uniref:DEAD/DEAH box helicase family protein n=1 Tax=Actinomadura bangladeshensis TaxID=453573 RepID=A0A6L9QQ77_9ACTN|nr:DEAD/DEAH box helicase family protein [Actinomadura bangladeshensis]